MTPVWLSPGSSRHGEWACDILLLSIRDFAGQRHAGPRGDDNCELVNDLQLKSEKNFV